jgi:hypothetical protein
MREIFISYRRDETAGYAGRIFDYLKAVFGHDRVFLDVDDILPGQVFADVIQERIAGCAVVIAVIGKRWLETLHSRTGAEPDYVSDEILSALKSSAVVIPVLVGGASMPKAADLPGSLAGLAGREALEIHDTAFAEDVACLVNAIKKVPGFEWQPPAKLTGTWIARMEQRGSEFAMRLDLEVFGDNLYGTVGYPTGEGAIQDAKLSGGRFSFHTSHVPQFESSPAVIRTEGELVGEQIRLISVSDGGIAKGFATRR